MKLNPYAVLLTTGVLMLATVVVAQIGTGVALVAQGAKSVDDDIASFAAKALSGTASDRALEVDRPSAMSERRASQTPGHGLRLRKVSSERYAAIDPHSGAAR